jgi:PAT family beta-lactamase induction signal transducer AmpG
VIPQKHLSWLIAIAVIVAFASATQDIAVDAYRLEIADDSRQAALAASYMSGYRVAALLATAGALFFAEGFGSTGFNYQHSAWTGTYALFGVLMVSCPVDLAADARTARAIAHAVAGRLLQLRASTGLGIRADRVAGVGSGNVHPALQHRFCQRAVRRCRSTCCSKTAPSCVHPLYPAHRPVPVDHGPSWPGAVLTPVNDFILRYRWQALLLLGLIATYRMSDTVMGVMANVFYIDQGFTKDQIASVSKILA